MKTFRILPYLETTAWATAKSPPSLVRCLTISLEMILSRGFIWSSKSSHVPFIMDCSTRPNLMQVSATLRGTS